MSAKISFIAWDETEVRQALQKLGQPGLHIQEPLFLTKDSYFLNMSFDAKLETWEKFDKWRDAVERNLIRNFVAPADNNDLVVFLLDGIPRRLVPIVCKVWQDRVKESAQSLNKSAKYQLAVLQKDQITKFEQGCADPEYLFSCLEAIRSFDLDYPLLLPGPSGSGKTLFAKFLHEMTMPADAPFHRENLASFSNNPDMLKSRLEGHEIGAYTGATKKRRGLFHEFQKGTIFFDELDGLSLSNQVQMLTHMDRAEGHNKIKILGLGNEEPVEIDRCKMIFATNRPINQAINEERLRPDFVYRCDMPIKFSSLNELFRETPERLSLYLFYFMMKVQPPLEDSEALRRRLSDTQLPQAFHDPEASIFKSIASFPWSGNFRTFEKYCIHLLKVGAFTGINFDVEADWDNWKTNQCYDTKTVEIEYPSPEAGKINIPRNAQTLPPEIFDQYRTILQTALVLSKKDGNGKSNLTIAAKKLGIDTRNLKKKLKAFGLES